MNNNLASLAQQWLSQPSPGHLVEFYPKDATLIASLQGYVGGGLAAGDTCIVIATSAHVQMLDARLADPEDTAEARRRGQYITLDAADTLASFMVDGLPDNELFTKTVGSLMDKVTRGGKPIRAYGEMVALLWQANNKEAVMRLEELWNQLAVNYSFALYCAYPALHFIMHPEVRSEIRKCHNVNTPALAA